MYKSDLIEAEAFIRRVAGDILCEEVICHPKVFDCPVCEHETLSETRQLKTDSGKKASRYCFNCGNLFTKEINWKKEVKGNATN